MIRASGTAALLVLSVVAPAERAGAHDAVGGAIMGGITGGYIGGTSSGRIEGAFFGTISGGTAGSIYGSDVEKRPGYFWRDGYCYHRARGRAVRVTKRLCY